MPKDREFITNPADLELLKRITAEFSDTELEEAQRIAAASYIGLDELRLRLREQETRIADAERRLLQEARDVASSEGMLCHRRHPTGEGPGPHFIALCDNLRGHAGKHQWHDRETGLVMLEWDDPAQFSAPLKGE